MGVDYETREEYDTHIGESAIIEKFSVIVDGETVATTTEAMDPTMDAVHFQVELPEKAESLVLHCESGDINWSDHADWADAKLVQKLPTPENMALASKGTTAKAIITETGEEYNAETFGGNTDSSVQIDKINDGESGHSDAGYYFDLGRDSQKDSIYIQYD